MTGNLFFDGVVLFLICYALIHIFYELGDWLIVRFSGFRRKEFILLSVHHSMESLEIDVRHALERSMEQKCALFIVDRGLDEQEKILLWRLVDSFDHVVIAQPQELSEKIQTAELIQKSL